MKKLLLCIYMFFAHKISSFLVFPSFIQSIFQEVLWGKAIRKDIWKVLKIIMDEINLVRLRSSHRRCSKKSRSEKFEKFTREHLVTNTIVTDFRTATLLKKRLQHGCFPVNCTKFLRTHLLQSTTGWLLLKVAACYKFTNFTFYFTYPFKNAISWPILSSKRSFSASICA